MKLRKPTEDDYIECEHAYSFLPGKKDKLHNGVYICFDCRDELSLDELLKGVKYKDSIIKPDLLTIKTNKGTMIVEPCEYKKEND